MMPAEVWRWLNTPGLVQSRVRDLWMDVRNSVASDPFARAYKTVRPYTMSGDARLRGLYSAVQQVTAGGISGDVVECGTARGGSAALLGLAVKDSGVPRRLWVFDTFEGIPAPTAEDPDYDVAVRYTGTLRGELEEVQGLFDRLGVSSDARLVKGRFQDTLPGCSVGPIAVLHIDGDWYDSVKCCLEHLYERVTPGGIIQIDDYGHWEGARKAVDEFMSANHVAGRLQYVDYTGRQLVKQ